MDNIYVSENPKFEKIPELDWKKYFFMLANRILMASAYLDFQQYEDARNFLREGKEIIDNIERAPFVIWTGTVETGKNDGSDENENMS